jgi:replication initiation and membrane attachment protein DnaB
MKILKNVSEIDKKGEKYIYSLVKEYEFEPDEVLNLASNNRVKIDELSKTISNAKQEIRVLNDFLSRNKKLLAEAEKDNSYLCEKCGMNFRLPVNKGMKSNKTKAPYAQLCKNCVAKEGL